MTAGLVQGVFYQGPILVDMLSPEDEAALYAMPPAQLLQQERTICFPPLRRIWLLGILEHGHVLARRPIWTARLDTIFPQALVEAMRDVIVPQELFQSGKPRIDRRLVLLEDGIPVGAPHVGLWMLHALADPGIRYVSQDLVDHRRYDVGLSGRGTRGPGLSGGAV